MAFPPNNPPAPVAIMPKTNIIPIRGAEKAMMPANPQSPSFIAPPNSNVSADGTATDPTLRITLDVKESEVRQAVALLNANGMGSLATMIEKAVPPGGPGATAGAALNSSLTDKIESMHPGM